MGWASEPRTHAMDAEQYREDRTPEILMAAGRMLAESLRTIAEEQRAKKHEQRAEEQQGWSREEHARRQEDQQLIDAFLMAQAELGQMDNDPMNLRDLSAVLEKNIGKYPAKIQGRLREEVRKMELDAFDVAAKEEQQRQNELNKAYEREGVSLVAQKVLANPQATDPEIMALLLKDPSFVPGGPLEGKLQPAMNFAMQLRQSNNQEQLLRSVAQMNDASATLNQAKLLESMGAHPQQVSQAMASALTKVDELVRNDPRLIKAMQSDDPKEIVKAVKTVTAGFPVDLQMGNEMTAITHFLADSGVGQGRRLSDIPTTGDDLVRWVKTRYLAGDEPLALFALRAVKSDGTLDRELLQKEFTEAIGGSVFGKMREQDIGHKIPSGHLAQALTEVGEFVGAKPNTKTSYLKTFEGKTYFAPPLVADGKEYQAVLEAPNPKDPNRVQGYYELPQPESMANTPLFAAPGQIGKKGIYRQQVSFPVVSERYLGRQGAADALLRLAERNAAKTKKPLNAEELPRIPKIHAGSPSVTGGYGTYNYVVQAGTEPPTLLAGDMPDINQLINGPMYADFLSRSEDNTTRILQALERLRLEREGAGQ